MKVNKVYCRDDMLCGRVTVDEDFVIAMADESFYKFAGANSLYSVDHMICEPDRGSFKNLVRDPDSDEIVVVRVKRYDEEYRWCLVIRVKHRMQMNDSVFTELELRDIISMNKRFSHMNENMNKYRGFLNLLRDYFFEYDLNAGILKIYGYVENTCQTYELDALHSWKERVLRQGLVEGNALKPFGQLCYNLENGVDSFTIQFENSILTKGEHKEVLNFRGQTMYKGAQKTMVAGIITTVTQSVKKCDDYFSAIDYTKDCATGLLNKKAITEFAINRINTFNSDNKDASLYLLILDIDNFKKVNDVYGHLFGDEVIATFANALKNIVGNRGAVGRIGGDEYMVILENVTEVEEIRRMLKSLRKSVAMELMEKKSQYFFTCSIGVSEYEKDATNYETLFKVADNALYIAKEKGKDRFIIYDKKKHGEIRYESQTTGRGVTMSEFMKPIEIVGMTSKIVMNLMEKRLDGIHGMLESVIEQMNIHGVSVYIGEDLNCEFSAGVYRESITDALYISEFGYLTLFDNHGINVINNVEALSMDFTEIYQMMTDSNICSSLQVLLFNEKKIIGMVSFDIFGSNKRKWNENDICALYMIVMVFQDIINKEMVRSEEKV